jgi:hypothetical protein
MKTLVLVALAATLLVLAGTDARGRLIRGASWQRPRHQRFLRTPTTLYLEALMPIEFSMLYIIYTF